MESYAVAKSTLSGDGGMVGCGVFHPTMLSHLVDEQEDDNVFVT
jgi:hypothetical protein